jgi:hypothetical protein
MERCKKVIYAHAAATAGGVPKFFCTLLFIWNITLLQVSAKDIFVSPNGNDHNPGTIQKPFATLLKAQSEARKYHETVTVWLRKGTYYLDAPIVFTAVDARSADAPLLFKPFRNEKPVISSARLLQLQWHSYKNGIMQAQVTGGNLLFDELFINGSLQQMARYPNYDTNAKHFNGTAKDVLSTERVARWEHPEGGFIHALHRSEWGDMSYEITGKDDKGQLTMIGGYQNNRPARMNATYRFAENIFEELDTVNEWYFNKAAHTLYYYPPKGLNLTTATVSTPQLETLFEFKGSVDKPITNITLTGLELTQTVRTFMKDKEPLLRSDWTIYREGTVTMNGTRNCAIKNCYFNTVGGNAIVFSNYNRDSEISGCHIADAGSSGVVFVGDPAAVRSPLFQYDQKNALKDMDKTPGPKTENYPAQCTVYNNLIEGIGRVEKQSAGVQLSMCQSITVSHNTIDSVPRSGINVNEGTWGGHIIEYNDVFNTVLETGDHGSFNSWGRDRFWYPDRKMMDSINLAHPELALLDVTKPIILRNNRFRCDHGWDIDLDDGSSNYQIYNNLCLNGGIKLREGFNRNVYNNVMINNSFHPHVWFKNSRVSFQHNIVSANYFPIGVSYWGDDVDNNLFPDSATLSKSTKNHTDGHSIYGDPLFVNAVKGDFNVKPNSPALTTGFKNFPMDDFGVVSPVLKKMAHTVVIPGVITKTGNAAGETIDFLGTKMKSLNTLGERSATGMASETGVLVLNVPKSSLLNGSIYPNDVLLAIDGKKIMNIKDLSAVAMNLQFATEIHIEIFRNQVPLKVTVPTK